VKEVILTKPREAWLDAFGQAGLTVSPVNEMADVVPDLQAKAMGYIMDVDDPDKGKVTVPGMPVKLSKTPGKVTKLAPQLGQHTEEVLIDVLGYSWEDIAKLREQGVY
jgi:CoA:oxalate CoA-transferase